MFEWIAKRILSTKAVDEYAQLVSEKVQDNMKDAVMNLLSDEEVAKAVTGYGDALYDRYQKKFWGQIGGLQKGLNAATENVNPLSSLLTGSGSLDLSGIIKRVLSGAAMNALSNATSNDSSIPSGSRKEYKYKY